MHTLREKQSSERRGVQEQLTWPLHYIVNGSVTDSCITWLDVHERFASNPHRNHLLHAQLWNPKNIYLYWQNVCVTWTEKNPNFTIFVLNFKGNSLCKTVCDLTEEHTSVSERLPPQDLAYNSSPYSLDLCRAGLKYKRVLWLPPTEPDLKT